MPQKLCKTVYTTNRNDDNIGYYQQKFNSNTIFSTAGSTVTVIGTPIISVTFANVIINATDSYVYNYFNSKYQ